MNWDVEIMAEEGQQESFVIDDDQKATWALKKIAEEDAELESMKRWYQSQIELLKARHDARVERLTAMLRGYFETVPVKDTKTQRKYSLPGGELVLSKAKKDFACEDPDALLGWCKENDVSLVKVKMEPAWVNVKKRLAVTDAGIVDTETGLVVDGVVELDKPEEFRIRLKEEDDERI